LLEDTGELIHLASGTGETETQQRATDAAQATNRLGQDLREAGTLNRAA
jgi:hypothetical protein